MHSNLMNELGLATSYEPIEKKRGNKITRMMINQLN